MERVHRPQQVAARWEESSVASRENPSVPLSPLWSKLLFSFSSAFPPSLCFWGLPPHLFISKSLFVLINRKYSNKLTLALVSIQGKQLRASTCTSTIIYMNKSPSGVYSSRIH